MVTDMRNSLKHPLMRHILHRQKIYLPLLFLLLLSVPLLMSWIKRKPLLMGEESYYHLAYQTFPLGWLGSFLPEGIRFLLPVAIALASLFLFYRLAKAWSMSTQHTFWLLLFSLLTPAVLYSYATLSAASWALLLFLATFWLLSFSGKMRYLALLPVLFTALTDILTALLLMLLLAQYFYRRQEKGFFPYVIVGIMVVATVLVWSLKEIPIVLGPFYSTDVFTDLISDLGGRSGVGTALLLLAFIGCLVVWRERKLRALYGYLLLLLAAYMYQPQTILYLSILLVVLAVEGFRILLERQWTLDVLQTFTLLLVLLTLLFSTITYIERVHETPPSGADASMLASLQSDTTMDVIVYSASENSYFLRYFAARAPFYEPHTKDKERAAAAETILNSTYIDTTFPILETYGISHLYLTPAMRENPVAQQGIFFILKNERFKLLHAEEGYELWRFEEER